MKKLQSVLITITIFAVGIVGLWVNERGLGNANVSNEPDEKIFPQICESNQNPIQCWDNLLVKMLENNGAAYTFERLAQLIEDVPMVKNNCHDYTHSLGETAYRIMISKEKLSLSSKTIICNYGFYHGLAETMLIDTGDPAQANNLCAYIDKELKRLGSDSKNSCFHGLGHGAANPHDPRLYGDELKIIKSALELCEATAQMNIVNLHECAGGVFKGIAIFYIEDEYDLYELSVNEEDPLWLCSEQPDRYKQDCLNAMGPVLMWLANEDFVKAASYLYNLEDAYARQAVRALSVFAGLLALDLKDGSYEKVITICHALPSYLQLSCLGGFAQRVQEFGEPGKEYLVSLDFCSQVPIESQRTACRSSICESLGGEAEQCMKEAIVRLKKMQL